MSEFNSYAKKVDEIARTVFAEYVEREQALKKATDKMNASANGSALEKARAKADYEQEKETYGHFLRNNPGQAKDDIANIRAELEKAISSQHVFDAEQVDSVTLELLKSGLLTAREYADILTKAEKTKNYTLSQLVGRYAMKQARETSDTMEQNALYSVHARSNADSANRYLADFDTLTDIFNRTVNNTAMIGYWDSLAGSIIENF